MHITVLGASGRAGSEITRELARRGHTVTAIARKPETIPQLPNVTPTQGDASTPATLAPLIAGSDAVISALHFDVPAATLLTALKQAKVPRLLVTGGAASLTTADGSRLFDSPDFPAAWKPTAQAGIDFLADLTSETEIDWTFFSPAAFIFEGPRLGTYRTATDTLITDDKGESRISFADYALAMVDELEAHTHPRARFTAAY